MCEHVLATMALEKKIDLDAALQSLPVRRAPGRAKKPRGPLARDVSDAHYFSVKNLIRLLTKSPAQCLHWALMKEFEIEVDGETTTEYVAERISGWQQNNGRYAWSVRFPRQ
jgi:hypothetical protein